MKSRVLFSAENRKDTEKLLRVCPQATQLYVLETPRTDREMPSRMWQLD